MAALLNWEVMRPHAKPENPVQMPSSTADAYVSFAATWRMGHMALTYQGCAIENC